MPAALRELAERAAAASGFAGFEPDACLLNQYRPGARLSLHQDRDECDLTAPVVSVSLGLTADFLWGGPASARRRRADSRCWQRATAMRPLADGTHPLTGAIRYNLTFRKAR